jgi:hypothetical protein
MPRSGTFVLIIEPAAKIPLGILRDSTGFRSDILAIIIFIWLLALYPVIRIIYRRARWKAGMLTRISLAASLTANTSGRCPECGTLIPDEQRKVCVGSGGGEAEEGSEAEEAVKRGGTQPRWGR